MSSTPEKHANIPSPGAQWYVTNFERFEKSLNGEAASFVHEIRKSAIAQFAKLGFPTTRDEEWKYTDVSSIAKLNFTPVVSHKVNGLTKKDLLPFTLNDFPCHTLVCVNGHFSKELSSIHTLPKGVKLGSLADAVKDNDELVRKHLARYIEVTTNAFSALSTAFLYDGVYVHIPQHTLLDLPIHLLFVSSGLETEFVVFPRNLIVLDANSQAAIVESSVGVKNNLYFANAAAEVVLGENAVLEYDKLQMESERAFHVSNLHVQQERNSNFTSNAISFGGSLVRNNIVAGNAKGIEASSSFTPATGQVGFNDVWQNALANWTNYPAAYGTATTTNPNGTPADAEMNIAADPLFVSAADYHLRVGPPARNPWIRTAA